MTLELVESTRRGHVVLTVSGDLDALSAPDLRERIVELIGAGEHHVVVDLQPVEFLDSSGLSALVTGRKTAADNGATFSVVCTNPGTLKVFKITQLDQVFDIQPSVEAATS